MSALRGAPTFYKHLTGFFFVFDNFFLSAISACRTDSRRVFTHHAAKSDCNFIVRLPLFLAFVSRSQRNFSFAAKQEHDQEQKGKGEGSAGQEPQEGHRQGPESQTKKEEEGQI